MNKPTVKLTGIDSNAFMILAKVMKELKKAGYSADQVKQYEKEATAGDYDNLLQVTSKWVVVE